MIQLFYPGEQDVIIEASLKYDKERKPIPHHKCDFLIFRSTCPMRYYHRGYSFIKEQWFFGLLNSSDDYSPNWTKLDKMLFFVESLSQWLCINLIITI